MEFLMRYDLDPEELTTDERTHELVAILAAYLRRLRSHTALASAQQNLPEISSSPPALPLEMSVTVTPG